ncbi:MAG: GntR domain protein [Gemmatimonadetes bacterium]|nr:GntR domain protein [Gemmatimonadota bacterium]
MKPRTRKAVPVPAAKPRLVSGPDMDEQVLPLRRQTLTGMTLDSLRHRILRGQFPEGEPLRQDAIAESLGVSRIPVREALRQLEAEGLVTFSPHKGAVVSTLSADEVAELFELRADIEADLMMRSVPLMTTADDANAREVLDAYDVALRARDVPVWGELNWQFHSTLYAPSGRWFTLGVLNRLHQQSDRYLRMQLALTHGESRARQEHRAILAATKKRDAKAASGLMREHILGAGRALTSFLLEHRSKTPQRRRGKAIS